jgi:hypothetical protein
LLRAIPMSHVGSIRRKAWSATGGGHPLQPISAWLRAWLGTRGAPRDIALVACALLVPTLWSGLLIDDLFHRLVVQGTAPVPIGRLDLFNWIPDRPQERLRYQELGITPWWSEPGTRVNYFRPIAALTHFVDYACWPRAGWLMHLENLAWYAGLVLASAALYRRMLRPPAAATWVAGLATALYALDHAHAAPAAWIANRGSIMSAVLGILAILAHDRWRRERRTAFAPLAWLAFTLSLLAAEAGLAIGGYLIAHALWMEREKPWSRTLALLPYVVVTALWRLAYRALGHGVAGTGVNCDPLIAPVAFVRRAVQSVPILLASSVTAMPSDAVVSFDALPIATIVSAGILVLVGLALAPLLRRDAASRFFAVGAIASALPLGGVLPSDRYLFWTGLGVMGLIARLAGANRATECTLADVIRRWVSVACVVLRAGVSPLLFPLQAAAPGVGQDQYERLAGTLPSGPDTTRQTVVLLNSPFDLLATFLPVVRLAEGLPIPAHQYLLYAGAEAVTVTRRDRHTIEIASDEGWMPRAIDHAMRGAPFHRGEAAGLSRMRAEVEQVGADGRATVVRFSFADDLDAPTMVFLSWTANGFERFELPAVNASTWLPAPPLLLSGALRPHIRFRPVDP